MRLLSAVAALMLVTALPSENHAQEPLDGPGRTFQDPLLNNLVGEWNLKRKIDGRLAENMLIANWVLDHQFLRIHMKDIAKQPQYEAMVFIGYDYTSERYVAHWMDVFGGRSSVTLGFGIRTGNAIKFVFEYPDGPFHNTFSWNPQTMSWHFLMQQKNKDGKWVIFAEDTLTKR